MGFLLVVAIKLGWVKRDKLSIFSVMNSFTKMIFHGIMLDVEEFPLF
jgi:hypothetical protein